ncbi:hypothetical protein AnigIFM50267_011117 [Aspergillus niger]|nr:hypothetical protein AnigIFM50267_011117 [Aspergillus niger]
MAHNSYQHDGKPIDLDEIHDYLISLAFRAGDIINSALPTDDSTGSKMNCVVFNPSTRTLYSAIQGRGSYLNRTTKLPFKGDDIGPLKSLENSLVGIEWGSERTGANWETKVRTFEKLGRAKEDGGAMVRSMRSMGSAALNLCAVAAGTLDLYWEGGCWAWDVCAGWVILTEAGGVIIDGNSGTWEATLDGRKYLAVRACSDENSRLELIKEFWGQIQGSFEY